MMIVLSVALGALIGGWSWRLGGMWAALVATFAYAFDPNFLAHGPLVKNDVPLTLITILLAIGVWRAGIRATVCNILAIGLLCGVALSTKFSGLVLGPAVAMTMIGRALLPTPWKMFRFELATRIERFAAACAILVAALIISWLTIWASYGFRFAPSRNPELKLNIRQMLRYTAINQLIFENKGTFPSDDQIARWRPNAFARGIVWLEKNRLLPQSWLIGLLYTYQSALARPSFLLGNHSLLGWWYYFPLAMLVKTPLTTLLVSAGAIAVYIFAWRKRVPVALPLGTWSAMCLTILPAFYMFMAMRSNLNLGIRHVLPVYPFIFIAIGIAVAWSRAIWPRAAKVATAAAGIGLALETMSVFPNYLAFFNAPAGGSRGGIELLSDSNLDWGQDLKLIAQWQQEHPNTPLYMMYFGFADPWAYGIEYRNFIEGYKYGPVFEWTPQPGVLAVSATHLQGVYYEQREIREFLARLRQVEPIEVLGGTIYLYRWPPPVPVPPRLMQQRITPATRP
jgi:4-amino-4-deoxy-L-arabinose transferase-like glycosyltransferase